MARGFNWILLIFAIIWRCENCLIIDSDLLIATVSELQTCQNAWREKADIDNLFF